MVINNTRYICPADSLPLPFSDSTCDCVSRPTRYREPTETTQALRTTFSTVHVTGQVLKGVPVETVTYHTDMSGISTISTAADAAMLGLTTPHGLSTSVTATTVEMTAFSLNSNVIGALASLNITTSLRFPTALSEVEKQATATATTISLDCPTDPQIIKAQHPKLCKSTLSIIPNSFQLTSANLT